MDLSNKSLALLLLAAIAVSSGGSFLAIYELNEFRAAPMIQTGDSQILGLQTGWAAVNITANVGCEIDSNVDFGTNATENILITTNTTNIGSGTAFNDCTTGTNCIGMEVNNTGNLDTFLNFSSSVTGSTFLGGPSAVDADFQYSLRNGTAAAPVGLEGGCFNNTNTVSAWGFNYANVPTTSARLCQNFSSSDANDIVTIEYNVTLRSDTPSGVKNATITVSCVQIG